MGGVAKYELAAHIACVLPASDTTSNNNNSDKAHIHSKRALKARNINMNIQTNKYVKIQLNP